MVRGGTNHEMDTKRLDIAIQSRSRASGAVIGVVVGIIIGAGAMAVVMPWAQAFYPSRYSTQPRYSASRLHANMTLQQVYDILGPPSGFATYDADIAGCTNREKVGYGPIRNSTKEPDESRYELELEFLDEKLCLWKTNQN